MTKICYVSAFLDIGRDEWKSFTRTFDQYLESFLPYIHLFKSHHGINNEKWCMVLYIDKKHFSVVKEKIEEIYEKMPITMIPIDEEFLENNLPIWTRLGREKEILDSKEYKTRYVHRLNFPENSNPKYTMINHAKIDFVAHTIHNVDQTSEYFCWTDFGYFKSEELIPKSLLSLEKLDKNFVNYTLINDLTDMDAVVSYTMDHAPEKIGGFFFFGDRDKLIQYQRLYHYVHLHFQSLNIVDDDQHMALRCYYTSPDLFKLHMLGKWHMAHIFFQHKHHDVCIYNKKQMTMKYFCDCF